MEFGEYAKYAVVSLSGFALFFLGVMLPLLKGFELIPIFALFLLTVIVCFNNKTPLGGLFYGLFTSISFLLGNLLTIVFFEFSLVVANGSLAERGLDIFLVLVADYVPEMVSFVAAFASLGLFFGILGYVFNRSSPETILGPLRHYRDYWSSIHALGKSDKREYSDLDRRFGRFNVTKKDWWAKVVSGIAQPLADLVFVQHRKRDEGSEHTLGDLYDLSSGRMLGSNLVSPSDLASKFRPFVLHMPEYSTNAKGVRRLFFEKLLGNYLEKLVPSKIVLGLFAALSLFFTYIIYLGRESSPAFELSPNLPVGIAIAFSAVTMFLVWKWRHKSQELFRKRPDERLFILTIYVVLALLYGFFYEMILNAPADTAGWVWAWFVWTKWFILLSAVLGLSYIFVHREVEVINTYFYDNHGVSSKSPKSPAYRDASDEPFWLANDNVKVYWVIRFMYYWRYELAKVPHSDWERVELWLDAENGNLRWVVSDYHYRELWYEVEGKLSSLYVSFFANFHTPIPILGNEEVAAISDVLNKQSKKLLSTVVTGKSQEIADSLSRLLDKKLWVNLHSSKWVSGFGLQNVAAAFSSKLPWRFWRYPHGLEKPERYREQAAARPEDEPTQTHNAREHT